MSIFARLRKALSPVPDWRRGWRVISEPFTGAWQQNKEEAVGDVLTYPTLYACIMRIAKDVGKLPFRVVRLTADGIWIAADLPDVARVLAEPNHYQTPQQFRESWQLAKMMQGNAYILKQFDAQGRVERLYPLDPCRVMPMVSDTGEVFYRLSTSDTMSLPLVDGQPTLPARFIIHDREITLHHPLIGVPPLAAASWPAVKNLRILRSSAEFFANNAQPGGILVAPGQISNETADRLKTYWNERFSGDKAGRIAVLGDDLKFTPLSAKSIDSQMVEQLRYSDEQICQPFGMPPFKVGIGSAPAGFKTDDINVQYHSDALSDRIEHMETLLDRGLGVELPLGIEMDLDPLWRMDEGKMAEVETKLVGGKVKHPDESRRRMNLPPTPGGDTLWGQHQDYPLGVLAQRNDLSPTPDPGAGPAQAATAGTVQQEALNGAQVTALQGILLAVAQGLLSATSAAAMIRVSFPLASQTEIEQMVNNAAGSAPATDDGDESGDDEEVEDVGRALSAALEKELTFEAL